MREDRLAMPAVAQKSMLAKGGREELQGFDAEKKKDVPAEAAQAPEAAVPLRSNFSETAFWQPHLLTGADGSAAIEFSVPDSVTGWRVFVHGVTKDLAGGVLEKEARTVKDLMVRPYLPRFFREGDRAELRVVVNNAGEADLSGAVSLEISDPATGENLASAFGLPASVPPRPFTVKPGGGATVVFPLSAPARVGTVAFKVTAQAGAFSDGELRPLPVLPGRMHLVQSRFVTLKQGIPRELTFPDLAKADDPTRINEQLVVTVDAQLFYGLLEALPYLVNYPYECTEQTLNRFMSTGILTSLYDKYPSVARMAQALSKRETLYETFDAADPNRKMGLEETPWLVTAQGGKDAGYGMEKVLDPRVAAAQREASLAKLLKAQTSLGAFPWWPGGPPSPYMTLYIVHGFSKALEFGVVVPKDPVVRAFDYLHRHYIDEIVKELLAHDTGWEFVTFLNYTLSNFPDASWTGGRLHGQGTDGDARLLVPALEGALALPQGVPGPDAEEVGEAEGRGARLGQRHGQRQNDGGRRHVVGAGGPRLALVQRHHRDPRLRPADAQRAQARRCSVRGARPMALPQQEAQPLEVHPGHVRGHLFGGLVPEDDRGAGRPGIRHRRRLPDENDVHVRAGQLHGKEEPDHHPGRQAVARVRDGPGGEGRQGHGLRQRDMAFQHGPDAGQGRRRPVRRGADILPPPEEGRRGRPESRWPTGKASPWATSSRFSSRSGRATRRSTSTSATRGLRVASP